MAGSSPVRGPWLGVMACSLVLAWSAGSVAGPAGDTPPERELPKTFTVEVDGAKVAGRLGATLHATCASGGPAHAVVVRCADPQHYDARGVTFDWPATGRLFEQSEPDWAFLTCELPGGTLATLEIREREATAPGAITAATLRARREWSDAFDPDELRGVSSKPVERVIAGAKRSGIAADAQVGDEHHLAEIYVLSAGQRTLVLTLEWDQGTPAGARKPLDTLAASVTLR